MNSPSTLASNERKTNGFRESLRFFQSQVDNASVPQNTGFKSTQVKNNYKVRVSEAGIQSKDSKKSNPVPSVDNILSNVKNLRENWQHKSITETTMNSNFPSVHVTLKSSESKSQTRIIPVTLQSTEQRSKGITRCEQVSESRTIKSNEHRKTQQSLLSSFNPTFDQELQEDPKVINENYLTKCSQQTNSKHVFVVNSDKTSGSRSTSDSLSSSFQNTLNKLNQNTCVKVTDSTVTDQAPAKVKFFSKLEEKQANDFQSSGTNSSSKFGEVKAKFADTKVDKSEEKLSKSSSDEDMDKKIDDENNSEKQSDSFESDYDPQDFVVHKTTFSEDYLEAMSEDYSSVNEDYEVEHPDDQPHGPDIPSPDYASDEEEHHETQHYEDVEYIENTAQYMNDPRRYVYYVDDKELEVIPEEDEDEIEDDDVGYSNEQSYNTSAFQLPNNNSSDESRYNNHGECDSGLTDDQRSSSTAEEECDLEDDTDSAKGSLPLQDSSSESPTYDRVGNMFQNVEYHKSKRSASPKTLIEDCDKQRKSIDIDTKTSFESIPVGPEDTEEMREARKFTNSWDPEELLKVLYRLDFPTEPANKKQTRYINKEGYLEKLPSGRKKATYWNPWKTKYIKLNDGFLYCFDNNHTDKPSMVIQLMGGQIESLEGKMIGVDDQKGHYVVLRCPMNEDIEVWENALRSHCAEDFVNAYTSPCLYPLSTNKNTIIVDIGSCSVRAGILMSSPSLPQLFFPTVCATNKTNNSQYSIFGVEALRPNVRKESQLSFPLYPSEKVTKYSIDVSILPDLLKHVFRELKVQPENYKIQLSIPRYLSLQTKLKIARMLLDDFKVKGLNLTHQAILSLHAYNSKSGIIVDIGDRLDVIPIIEGYIVESGLTHLPYGGKRMLHHLKHALAERNINILSEVENYLARYILEQLCYVAEDYNEELQRYHTNPDDFEMSISTSHFFKEECPWEEILLDFGRFHVPEGLFNPQKWGLDSPGLHKLVHSAIQECGVDMRREMSRSIYVSGGLTLLPGFVERLEAEIDKLTPNTIVPKVHASPYRYHMSYIGACQIALGDKFESVCITKQMWKKEGNTCVKKWHI